MTSDRDVYEKIEAGEILSDAAYALSPDLEAKLRAAAVLLRQVATFSSAPGVRVADGANPQELIVTVGGVAVTCGYTSTGQFLVQGPDGRPVEIPVRFNPHGRRFEGEGPDTFMTPIPGDRAYRRSALAAVASVVAGIATGSGGP